MNSPALQAGKVALITGISGFAGSHLAEYLLANVPDLQLHGITQSGGLQNLSQIANHPNLKLHKLDLEDSTAAVNLLAEIQPDYIFHLAARSQPGLSVKTPALFINTNINVALNLFSAVQQSGLAEKCRILNIGSGDQYGFLTPQDIPVQETTPFRPGNPYAVSKIAQEMLGYQQFRSYGLQIINLRVFNHLGPRLSAELAAGTFARQIALAEVGQSAPVIRVGNLEAYRDFTDVRDIVRAYWLAVATSEPGCVVGEAYNLCSGQAYKIAMLLDKLVSLASLPVKVELDPTRLRPSDVPLIRGNFSKFEAATGWQPQIPLEKSLADLLNFWRAKVRAG